MSKAGENSDALSLATAFETLIGRRYSCRAFQSRSVQREVIERILTAAQRTASWCNAQPWHVTITSGSGTERLRNALYEHAARNAQAMGSAPEYDFEAPREYHGVYLQRRRECGLQLYSSIGISKGDREAGTRQALENFRFFGAPHMAIITSEESLGAYGALDCGAYVSNFVLAANALGVASIAQAAIASYSRFLRGYLELPPTRKLVCGIAFGYADETQAINQFRTSRASLGEAMSWLDN
ncbi:MAG: nitroreductase [Steroidobacteraceae bacterium]